MSTHWNIYLRSEETLQPAVIDHLHALLASDSLVPAFPEAAVRLCALVQDENASMEDVAQIVSMDSGLTARCVQIASSIGYAARPIESIQQALALIGVQQIRRIAFAVAAIDTFSNFSANIDWQRFWMHNVLVARLTEQVAGTFRQPTGREYLAGLLHDVGKLIIEHHFPEQAKKIVALSEERKCGHRPVEREILGIDHAQIGAAMCDCMHVHGHILRAVWYHHDPMNERHTADANGDGGFLAACIAIADRMAHRANVGLADRRISEEVEHSTEWFFLQQLAVPHRLNIDLNAEVARTAEDVKAFMA